MMNSLFAGVSGLKGFETKMDVIGNNIANVNTAGFKTGRVTFSELLNQNVRRDLVSSDSAPRITNQVGLGVRVSSIDRNFEQGSFEATNVSTDLAIQGNSFFLVRDGEARLLTRAGSFKFNANGDLVTAAGLNVQGYNSNLNGNIIPGSATDNVNINFNDVFRPAQTSLVRVSGNLNSNTSTRETLSQISAFTANGTLATSATNINDLDQVLISGGLRDGDIVRFNATQNNGTAVAGTFTFGAANDGTTVNDIINNLKNSFGTDVAIGIEDGLVVLRSESYGESQLALSFSTQIARDPGAAFTASTTGTSRVLTQNGRFSINNGQAPALSTNLADLDQFTNLTAGDVITVAGTDQDGNALAAPNNTFTYGTGVGQNGTTMAQLIAHIDGAFDGGTAGVTGSLNSDGQIVLTGSEANDVQMTLTGITFAATVPSTATYDATKANLTALDSPNYQTTTEGSVGSKILSSTVYDSQGEAHTVVLKLSQTDFNRWSYETSFLNGETLLNSPTGNLVFDADGNFVSIQNSAGTEIDKIDISFTPGNGAGNMQFSLDFKGNPQTGRLTQYDGTTTAKVTDQDGFGKGELLDVFIDSEGYIVGSYSNGKTKNLSQIALARVTNDQGLSHVGDGLFTPTTQAGNLVVDTATNLEGESVNAGFLEGSNVDLAEQFTDMIITQRAYQSNARVITTADQLLAEAVQLKR